MSNIDLFTVYCRECKLHWPACSVSIKIDEWDMVWKYLSKKMHMSLQEAIDFIVYETRLNKEKPSDFPPCPKFYLRPETLDRWIEENLQRFPSVCKSTHFEVVMAWREQVKKLWKQRPGKYFGGLLNVECKSWLAWGNAYSYLKKNLLMKHETIIENVSLTVEMFFHKNLTGPPNPHCFCPPGWIIISKDLENYKQDKKFLFADSVSMCINSSAKALRETYKIGQNSWKSNKNKTPINEHDKWNTLLNGILLSALRAGALSPHFLSCSKTIQELQDKNINLGQAQRILEKKHIYVQQIKENPVLKKLVQELFLDECEIH